MILSSPPAFLGSLEQPLSWSFLSLVFPQNVSLSPKPQKLQRKSIQSFLGYQTMEILFFKFQKIVELLFFFLLSFQITKTHLDPWHQPWHVWRMRNKDFALFGTEREEYPFSLFFPFLWRQYFLLLAGWCILLTFQEKKCQWYARHNKRKSKEMKLQGTGNFIILSMKCLEENLI